MARLWAFLRSVPLSVQYVGAKGVELEIDLEARREFREAFREVRLIRDAYAIGVHHEMSHWPLSRQFQNLEELRVHSRLAPRNLDDGRLAFVRNGPVQHALDLLQAAVRLSLGPAARVARRAAQVAVVRYLDEQRTAVLLVVRADATVVRAAVAHRRIRCRPARAS